MSTVYGILAVLTVGLTFIVEHWLTQTPKGQDILIGVGTWLLKRAP